jgi:hypothetical protein
MAQLIRFLAPVLVAGIVAVSSGAAAGDLSVRDEAHVFSPGDANALRSVVARAPFDARLLTTTAYPDQASFSRYVGSLVSESDMVVVGIDPQHHHVQVHFGTRSGIPQASWSAIERSGNDAFRRGAWEEGSETIFRTAAANAVTSGGGGASLPQASRGSVSLLGPVVLLLIVGGVILAVIFFSRRRTQGYDGMYGGGGYAGPGPYPGGAPPYGGGGYYGPGAPSGGMGPLGGGIIGAGLGGLAGYELGKMAGEREEREHEHGGGFGSNESSLTGDDSSYDAGGGGSSWDDSGGGGDFGGGGGDFGGGDSGGGGSDF